MRDQVLQAFQVLEGATTWSDVLEACRQLFMHSDEYHHAGQNPFVPAEVDAVGKAILEYIENPDYPVLREIVFQVPRPLEGSSIEINEYASIFSDDMLYQNGSIEFASLDLEYLRSRLKIYLVGILFRYQFCISEDRAAFPVSKILDYMDGVKVLFSQEQRDAELHDALWTTLKALDSLEPHHRIEEEA
ncbi:MAG: hypothetical protein SFX18_13540 [Pirellulales bacterium]|nr:hypothetical protein [Pirellulales bacterium]